MADKWFRQMLAGKKKKKLLLAFEKAGAGGCTIEALGGVGPTFGGYLRPPDRKTSRFNALSEKRKILMSKQRNHFAFLLVNKNIKVINSD